MIEILEMRPDEIRELLKRVGYGHLACARGDQPYVVPIYYVYDGSEILIYTTAGLKSEIIKVNPKICLQVEEFLEGGAWQSVVVTGEAYQVVDATEREEAVKVVSQSNPTLLPALAIKWANDWMRQNIEVVYKVKVLSATGRFTSDIKITAASAQPNFCQ